MVDQPSSRAASGTRLRLDVAYDGSGFAGWARQPGLRTVQGELEAALATILRHPPDQVRLTCAGRTDAGVHARGQVCHLDLPAVDTSEPGIPDRLLHRLWSLLPDDIAVRAVRFAPAGFDARFSATFRRYAYRLVDAPAAVDPRRRAEVAHWRRRLDEAAMAAATPPLEGLHDFAAFCRPRPGATTIRRLTELTCRRTDAGIVEVWVQADAFCHSMVRAVVGALVAVGEGRRQPDWPDQVLQAGRRDPGVRVMPPGGLTLERVGYPPDERLAERARTARAVRTLP